MFNCCCHRRPFSTEQHKRRFLMFFSLYFVSLFICDFFLKTTEAQVDHFVRKKRNKETLGNLLQIFNQWKCFSLKFFLSLFLTLITSMIFTLTTSELLFPFQTVFPVFSFLFPRTDQITERSVEIQSKKGLNDHRFARRKCLFFSLVPKTNGRIISIKK